MYKIYIIFCFFLFIACQNNNKAVVWDANVSLEKNIASNADYLSSDSSFSFLDDIIKKHDIIILGEASHYDSSVFVTKTKMVKYLMKKGINTMVSEGAPFLPTYVMNNPEYKEITKKWDWNESYLWSIWESTPHCQEVLEMVKQQKLKFWGMDCYLGCYDVPAVQAILNKYKAEEPLQMNWKRLSSLLLKSLLQDVYDRFEIPESEYSDLMKMIDAIANHTHYLISIHGETMDLSALLQWIRNVNAGFGMIAVKIDSIPFERRLTVANRIRDFQMAENTKWWVDHFPNEKFMLWAANFHGAKDISQTVYNNSLDYYKYQTMGEHLTYYLKDKVYSLAMTSHLSDTLALKTPYYEDTLEQELFNKAGNTPYCFINFEPLRFHSGFRDKKFMTTVIKKKNGNWMSIFDGVYYKFDKSDAN